MDGSKIVQFECPVKLIKQVDEKFKTEGKYSHRSDLLRHLLRKYVEEVK